MKTLGLECKVQKLSNTEYIQNDGFDKSQQALIKIYQRNRERDVTCDENPKFQFFTEPSKSVTLLEKYSGVVINGNQLPNKNTQII